MQQCSYFISVIVKFEDSLMEAVVANNITTNISFLSIFQCCIDFKCDVLFLFFFGISTDSLKLDMPDGIFQQLQLYHVKWMLPQYVEVLFLIICSQVISMFLGYFRTSHTQK